MDDRSAKLKLWGKTIGRWVDRTVFISALITLLILSLIFAPIYRREVRKTKAAHAISATGTVAWVCTIARNNDPSMEEADLSALLNSPEVYKSGISSLRTDDDLHRVYDVFSRGDGPEAKRLLFALPSGTSGYKYRKFNRDPISLFAGEGWFYAISVGPDRTAQLTREDIVKYASEPDGPNEAFVSKIYDPTNGAVSAGDIVWGSEGRIF